MIRCARHIVGKYAPSLGYGAHGRGWVWFFSVAGVISGGRCGVRTRTRLQNWFIDGVAGGGWRLGWRGGGERLGWRGGGVAG